MYLISGFWTCRVTNDQTQLEHNIHTKTGFRFFGFRDVRVLHKLHIFGSGLGFGLFRFCTPLIMACQLTCID